MKSEDYLEFLDGNMTGYVFNCPFPLPVARTYQAMIMVAVTYRNAMELKEILNINEHAIAAFREEINQSRLDIMIWKASVEN